MLASSKIVFKSGVKPAQVAAARPGRRGLRVEARSSVPEVGVFGTKAGMMSFFTPEGLCVPATVIAMEPGNIVTMIKTEDTDGYNAVQVGYKVVAKRKVTKPELGHLEKAGVPPLRHLREFKLESKDKAMSYTPGQQLEIAEIFSEGGLVDIAGKTVGKGFQGNVKRHGHRRGMMTHGSKSHRQIGSVGPGTTPGRIFPGLKMPGQMGNVRRTVKMSPILKVDAERKALVVKGSVPGKPGALLEIIPAKVIGQNC